LQTATVDAAWYCVVPDASRPYDSKHVWTQPFSALRHQFAVLAQL